MPISALKASKFFSSRMLMLAFYTAIFFFFALSALGIHAKYWSDSEIWGVRQASACWSTDWQSYACAQKPLFNLLVGGILAITDQVSVAPLMEMARNLTTISWALTIVIAIFYGMSAPMVLCFLGSSLFFMDASVARSDILALPLEVFFIGYVLRFTNEKPKAAWPLVLSALAAILMTPKSLFTFICLIPLFAPLFPKRLFLFG